MAIPERAPLLTAALLIALIKAIEFAIDSQTLLWFDSRGFILNAVGLRFSGYRSYVYGGLIRAFAVSFHSFRAIVAMQVIMGGLSAWLLTYALVRFLRVRVWIAILAGLVFALDPVQIVYEHMVMAETATMLAMAVFIVGALQYLEDPSLVRLAILPFLGIILASLRLVYVPVVLATAVLLPAATYLWSSVRRPRLLVLGLMVSCGSAAICHVGYQHLTGWLAGREPAYLYEAGLLQLGTVAPIVEPRDTDDPRVAAAIQAQKTSSIPLSHPNERYRQLWDPEGLVGKFETIFGDQADAFPGSRRGFRSKRLEYPYYWLADQAAQRVARAAILRNPLGFLRLGVHNYLAYWRDIRFSKTILTMENGQWPEPQVRAPVAGVILSAFGADVSNEHLLNTPSRRYHVFARGWQVFLLAAPFLTGFAWWLSPANSKGVAFLFFWNCLLMAATCLGAVQDAYRFLHPFSFTGLAAAALLLEAAAGRRVPDSLWTPGHFHAHRHFVLHGDRQE
jgi:hypothetical protein